MDINEYIKPSSIEEAYEILNTSKNSVIIGGGAFLRLGRRKYNKIIDISNFNLNTIEETEEFIKIGALTTLRDIETSEILKKIYSGMLPAAISEIMGVQLRNIATIGGSVAGKYGFSDILTPLLVMDTKVELYKNKIISLDEFLDDKKYSKDIILSIIINKKEAKAKFRSLRLTSSDFSTLNVAVSKTTNNIYKVAVGARPHKASLSLEASEYLNNIGKMTVETAERAGEIAVISLSFQSNIRGSKEYREDVAKAFIKRTILDINFEEMKGE